MYNKSFIIQLMLFVSSLSLGVIGAQDIPESLVSDDPSSFIISVAAGYDLPAFDLPYEELDYRGGRYLNARAGYFFTPLWGAQVDFTNIITKPESSIPDLVYFGSLPKAVSRQREVLHRNYLGIGPVLRTGLGRSLFAIEVAPSFGRSWLNGGDIYLESDKLPQLLNTGYNTDSWAAKLNLGFQYSFSSRLNIGLNAYYLRHFQVHPDNKLSFASPPGMLSISHGENLYVHATNPYEVSSSPPNVVPIDPDQAKCTDLTSFGASVSLTYVFGQSENVRPPAVVCNNCCPDDGHKLIVTVQDAPTKQMINDADVVLKDLAGEIVSTGTTNGFGAVEFYDVPHGTYLIEGALFGVATTSATIAADEFQPDEIVRKELFYEDLRFVLKGVVLNKNSRLSEPNVIARLTNEQSGQVNQDNTDGGGNFSFQLNGNTEYRIVGSKKNRLSDIERVSTIGLLRSTTLFVELELGVDDFDCGLGTVLNIKYNLASYDLLPEARFELDRLVQYLKDNTSDRVELGSHTDSQGSKAYNQNLSEQRANSAVNYIIGRGVDRDRILARGYGESRILNRCTDGINCSDAEHRVNRRTEAKLLCK
ncbi:hypothetical protein CEQ90_05665 [Lewinellaceae bacterium SD302]|nr:hypothetical protein CEQ90_05665 [Lewinellaceae bacterium SD302]